MFPSQANTKISSPIVERALLLLWLRRMVNQMFTQTVASSLRCPGILLGEATDIKYYSQHKPPINDDDDTSRVLFLLTAARPSFPPF